MDEKHHDDGSLDHTSSLPALGSRHVEALFFPVALGANVSDHNWSTVVAEEVELDELHGDSPNQTFLQSDATHEWQSFRMQLLLLPFSFYWKVAIIITTLINYFVCSFVYVFYYESTMDICLKMHIVDVLYTIDLIISLIHRRSKFVTLQMNVKQKQMSSLIVQMVSLTPALLVYAAITGNVANQDIAFWLRSLTFIRIYHVYEIFAEWINMVGKHQTLIYSVRYTLIFITSLHAFACIWYSVANRMDTDSVQWKTLLDNLDFDIDHSYEWYYISFYYCLGIVTACSLGEIYATNFTEMIISLGGMIFGLCLFTGFYISNLTFQISNKERRRSLYVEKFKAIINHLHNIKITPQIKNEVMRYYSVLWEKKKGVKDADELNLLPLPLQMEAAYDIYFGCFMNSLLLKDLGEPFLRKLALSMKSTFHLPGEIIYHKNVVKYTMIYIKHGIIEILSEEDNETPVISFTSGTYLGDISLILTVPARATVRAATYTELQKLHKADFLRMLVDFPYVHKVVRENIKKRIDIAYSSRIQVDEDSVILSVVTAYEKQQKPIRLLKQRLRQLQGLAEPDDIFIKYVTTNKDLPSDFLALYNLTDNVHKHAEPLLCYSASFPWILVPDSNVVLMWQHVMFVLVLFISFIYPLYIGFSHTFPSWFYNLSVVLDVCLFFDLYLQCTTAVVKDDFKATKVKDILFYRTSHIGFYLDALATIPIEAFSSFAKTKIKRDYLSHVLKLNRVLRAWKIPVYFFNLESKIHYNLIIIRFVKYMIYVLLSCEWCGVLLYMTACFNGLCDENSWITMLMLYEIKFKGEMGCSENPLILSTYFSITCVCGTGIGDLFPHNAKELYCVCLIIVYGALLTSHCTAQFAATFTMRQRAFIMYQEAVLAIKGYMNINMMSQIIQERVLNYFQLQWIYDGGVKIISRKSLLADATMEIKEKVLSAERMKSISSVPLFKHLNLDFVHIIATNSRMLILPPSEFVTYAGGIAREMYIVEEGYCQIISENKVLPKIIAPGSHFGDIEMLFGTPRMVTAMTLTHCKLICIEYSLFSQALSSYPDIKIELDSIMEDEDMKMKIDKRKVVKTPKISGKRKTQKLSWNHYLRPKLSDNFINVLQKSKCTKQVYSEPFKKLRNFRFIKYLLLPVTIKPDGIFLKIWCTFRVIIATFICILGPYQQSIYPFDSYIKQLSYGLHTFSFLDIYLMMHVCYFNEYGILVTHPLQTASHYITHNFVLDLFSSLPFDLMIKPKGDYFQHTNSSRTAMGLLRLNTVLQIYRVPLLFRYLEANVMRKSDYLCIFKTFLLMVVFINMLASLLVSMTCHIKTDHANDLNKNAIHMECRNSSWFTHSVFRNMSHPIEVYIVAYYWISETMCGIGFTNVTAQNYDELIFISTIIVLGTFLIIYILAIIISSNISLHSNSSHYCDMMQELINFMKSENVDTHLRQCLVNHFEYQWKRSSGVQPQQMFDKLHSALMEDAVLFLYEKTLREVPLFENVDQSFLRVIGKHMKEVYFLKGTTIIKSHDVQSNIYIIYRGKVEVISSFNEMMTCIGPGGIFGNISSIAAAPCRVTIVSSQNMDALTIPSEKFYQVVKSYPIIKKRIESVLETTKDYLMPSTVFESESLKGDSESESEEEELSDENGTEKHQRLSTISEKTVHTSILDSKNKHFGIICSRRGIVILPESAISSLMGYIVLIASYAEIILITYHATFQDHNFSFIIVSIAMELIFYINILLECLQAYTDKYGTYITDVTKIRERYVKNNWKVRTVVIINFPYGIFSIIFKNQLLALSLLRLINLGRVYYIFQFYQCRKNLVTVNRLLLKLSSTFIALTLFAHLLTCIWFLLSCPIGRCIPNTWTEYNKNDGLLFSASLSMYIKSMYFIIDLIGGVGCGNRTIRPYTITEIVFTIIVILIGKVSVALFVCNITTLLNTYSSTLVRYQYVITGLIDHFSNWELSNHQMDKVQQYVKRLWERGRGNQMPRLILTAPLNLKSDLMNAVYGHHIRNSYIFRNLNEDFLRQLTVRLRHYLFFEGAYILQDGDINQNMYIIHRGEVSVLTIHPNLTETVHDTLKPSEMFGLAQGLYHGVPHCFSFRAKTAVDILVLNLDEWQNILKYFPAVRKILYARANSIYMTL